MPIDRAGAPVCRRQLRGESRAPRARIMQHCAMHDFTPIPALIGGTLIGLAASLLLLGVGRIAGVSGIAAAALLPQGERRDSRAAFLGGLVAAGLVASHFVEPSLVEPPALSFPPLIAAGLLVGFGTRLGNGCTSGHGVCGLSRLSVRSLAATITFMAAGVVAVYLFRHALPGGAR